MRNAILIFLALASITAAGCFGFHNRTPAEDAALGGQVGGMLGGPQGATIGALGTALVGIIIRHFDKKRIVEKTIRIEREAVATAATAALNRNPPRRNTDIGDDI